MKKIVLASIIIGFSSLVFASGDMFVKPTNYFDGLYVGIGGGVNHTNADISASSVTDFGFLEPALGASQIEEDVSVPHTLDADDLGDVNAAGEIFVGYGLTDNINSDHNNFYLGVELFGKYVPTDMNVDGGTSLIPTTDEEISQITGTSSMSASLENNFSVGGALRIGYLFTPKTMIYVMAGVEAASFDYKVSSGVNYSVFGSDSISDSFSDKVSQTKFGFMPGVGIETMLSDHFSLRAQYVYTFFGDIDLRGSHQAINHIPDDGFIVLDNTADGDVDDISRGLFTIDLTYHFNNWF
jgi:opacity protein-like surface antigen